MSTTPPNPAMVRLQMYVSLDGDRVSPTTVELNMENHEFAGRLPEGMRPASIAPDEEWDDEEFLVRS